MSKVETKNEQLANDAASSCSSKWASSSDLEIWESFSQYGPEAVEQMNAHLEDQERARRTPSPELKIVALANKKAAEKKLDNFIKF